MRGILACSPFDAFDSMLDDFESFAALPDADTLSGDAMDCGNLESLDSLDSIACDLFDEDSIGNESFRDATYRAAYDRAARRDAAAQASHEIGDSWSLWSGKDYL